MALALARLVLSESDWTDDGGFLERPVSAADEGVAVRTSALSCPVDFPIPDHCFILQSSAGFYEAKRLFRRSECAVWPGLAHFRQDLLRSDDRTIHYPNVVVSRSTLVRWYYPDFLSLDSRFVYLARRDVSPTPN